MPYQQEPPHERLMRKEKDDTSCLEHGKFSWFKSSLGGLDGTLLPMTLPEEVRGVWNSRKGTISQNVFAACGFDMVFHFVLAGYEGSAPDGTVLERAYKSGFKVPRGRYYLADGGYKVSDQRLLVPFESTRYHIRYSILAQTRFIVCCFVIYNFILLSGDQPLSGETHLLKRETSAGVDADVDAEGEMEDEEDPLGDMGDVGDRARVRFRDAMAESLWMDYLRYLEQEGKDMRGPQEGIFDIFDS
ncbi:unnamed protein product [Zymoseptoria tritici ST99CH_3D1]|nr:unnamed protein product [Zymoseptoria tritici ST99CH_3D1]